MKISTEYTPDRQAIVTVEVDDEQMQGALKRAAQSVSRIRPLPGFRPGRAPYEMVERAFGKDLLVDEAVEELARSLYAKVLKESEVQAVEVGSLDIVQKDPPIFKYTIPVVPEVKLGDYKSIHMTPGQVEVSDEEVEQVINRFQLTQATTVPVTRPAQKGDVITADVVGGLPSATPVEEKNLRVTIGDDKGARLPFDEQLIGMNPGETREIDFTYPEDYSDTAYRGQTAHYTVTLHDIKETQLPELTDEFAQAVSQFKTLDQFRGNIRDILRRQKERDEENRFANSVLEAVADQAEIAFPPVMLEHELDHDVEHFQDDVKRLGLAWDQYVRLSGKTPEEIRTDLRPTAEKRLRQMLVLGELIKAENITVTPQEVSEEIERRVEAGVQEGGNANTLRRAYRQKDARENLEFNLRVNRLMDRLLAIVRGDPTSGKILTPDMVRDEANPIPSGLIADPRQVREQDWPRGLELPK